MFKPIVSCLWGCGESVNPSKLNIQEIWGEGEGGGGGGLCPLDQREIQTRYPFSGFTIISAQTFCYVQFLIKILPCFHVLFLERNYKYKLDTPTIGMVKVFHCYSDIPTEVNVFIFKKSDIFHVSAVIIIFIIIISIDINSVYRPRNVFNVSEIKVNWIVVTSHKIIL